MRRYMALHAAVVLAAIAATGCGTLPMQSVGDPSDQGPRWMGRPTYTAGPTMAPQEAQATPTDSRNLIDIRQSNFLGSVAIAASGSVDVQQINQTIQLLVGDPGTLMHGYQEIRGALAWDAENRQFFIAQSNQLGDVTVVSGASSLVQQINHLVLMLDPHAKNLTTSIAQTNAILSLTVVSGDHATLQQINVVTLAQGARDQDDGRLKHDEGQSTREPIVYIDREGEPHLYVYVPEADL